jgi:hypothetical protein
LTGNGGKAKLPTESDALNAFLKKTGLAQNKRRSVGTVAFCFVDFVFEASAKGVFGFAKDHVVK